MVRTFTFLLDFFQFWGKFSDFVDGQQNNTPGLILIKYQYPAHSALLTVLTVFTVLTAYTAAQSTHSSHYSQCFPVSIDHHSAHSAPALYCALYLIFQNIAHNDFTMLHYNKNTDQNTLPLQHHIYKVQLRRRQLECTQPL